MLRRLRYTRAALLLFGLGLALGFIVVVGELGRFGRVASVLMVLGLLALMPAFAADLRALALRAWAAMRRPRGRKAARPRGKARAKGKPSPARRRVPARPPRGRRA
ncbi:MAG TPA: hypothetical protein VFX06_08890 [Stellaceae bacterium]|nr:hypothetical protein [Stellaceae bacterium]